MFLFYTLIHMINSFKIVPSSEMRYEFDYHFVYLPAECYFILWQLAAANNWTDLQKFASKRKLAQHAIRCAPPL